MAHSESSEAFVAGVGELVGDEAGKEVGAGGQGLSTVPEGLVFIHHQVGGPEEPTDDSVQLRDQLLLLTQPLVNLRAAPRQAVSPGPRTASSIR